MPYNSEGYERAKTILKSTCGKPSKLASARIQNIVNLPVISRSNPNKIHDFYEKLITSVQSLDTMGKLQEINGYVRSTLDKLPGTWADLARLENDWQEWKQSAEAFRQWTERNPISQERKTLDNNKKDRLFSNKQHENKIKGCLYWNKEDHKSIQFKTFTDTNKRQKILSEKMLSFNCAGEKHGASECNSEETCRICNRKQHSSICDKDKGLLLTTNENKASVT